MAGLTLALAAPSQAQAQQVNFEAAFDSALGTEVRAPRDFSARYDSPLAQQIAAIAEGSRGRIGVAALDLVTGEEVAILGEQRFPMASTSKIAIAATYLEGVDQGRLSLTSEFPLLVPVPSKPFSSPVAPVRKGEYLSALKLIDLMNRLVAVHPFATVAFPDLPGFTLKRCAGDPDSIANVLGQVERVAQNPLYFGFEFGGPFVADLAEYGEG